MKHLDFSNYLSPFTWRYGSPQMRRVWSEQHKYEIWRQIWIALAQAQHQAGLVTTAELSDLKKHQHSINIDIILDNEKETKHDVVAAIREFASQCKIGGGKVHLGATSMDVVDNTDVIRMREALQLIQKHTHTLLQLFAEKVKRYAATPCIGYTHLQPAEPTTVGYRFAFYAQDLLNNLAYLQFVLKNMQGKGFKGAVGTSASYTALLNKNRVSASHLEELIMKELDLKPMLVTGQVYSREQDYLVLSAVNLIAATLAKFAGDLRILQSPNYGEWSEPFGKKQVGSSAMPFKKNPINAEKICSLARMIAQLPNVALENATLSYLERTLDDSANRRIVIAEAFLAIDEICLTAAKILENMVINTDRLALNLAQYAPFAATEAILMAAVKKGADRQLMHEVLREISMKAWQLIQTGQPNPMSQYLATHPTIQKFLGEREIKSLLNVEHHIGNAPQRALKLAKQISNILKVHA